MIHSKITGFKDLIVWQKSMLLVTEIYKPTDHFPKSEIYGLTSQMRRSAVSIPSNIAEGRKRGTRKEFRQFLMIASGSSGELETQLEIAKRLNLAPSEMYKSIESLLTEVKKMLYKMIAIISS